MSQGISASASLISLFKALGMEPIVHPRGPLDKSIWKW